MLIALPLTFSFSIYSITTVGFVAPGKIEFVMKAVLLIVGALLSLKRGRNMTKALLVYPTRLSPELKARLIVAAANLKTTPAALAREAIEQAVKLSESLETNSKNPIA